MNGHAAREAAVVLRHACSVPYSRLNGLTRVSALPVIIQNNFVQMLIKSDGEAERIKRMNWSIKKFLTLNVVLIFSGMISVSFAQTEPAIGSIEVFDGRAFPENPKATGIEEQLIKKEVRAQESKIKNIAQSKEFECDQDDLKENASNADVLSNLNIYGVLEGAFTKPKSLQKAFLYQICWSDGGKYATALGGIVIVEKEKIVSHFVYSNVSGFDNIRVLPDINRNGLSEVVLRFTSHVDGFFFSRSIALYEFDSDKPQQLGEAETDAKTTEGLRAYKIFVKAGETPSFYREAYVNDSEENWQIKEKAERFSLEKVENELECAVLPLNAPDTPSLTAKEISQRVIKLIKSIKTIKDLSPENIERVMKIKVNFRQENRNRYGFAGSVADSSWLYSLQAYPYPLGKNEETDTLSFSFWNKTENAEMKPVCAVDFDFYSKELKKAGFSAEQYYGEHGRLLWWNFSRAGNVSAQISFNGESPENAGHKCVTMVILNANKK